MAKDTTGRAVGFKCPKCNTENPTYNNTVASSGKLGEQCNTKVKKRFLGIPYTTNCGMILSEGEDLWMEHAIKLKSHNND